MLNESFGLSAGNLWKFPQKEFLNENKQKDYP